MTEEVLREGCVAVRGADAGKNDIYCIFGMEE